MSAGEKFTEIVSEFHSRDSCWFSLACNAKTEYPSVKLFKYLTETEKCTRIYSQSNDPFSDFIKGYGNPQLYHDVCEAIRHQIQDKFTVQSFSILDIGPGDGKVLFNVLSNISLPQVHVDLVEPSNLLTKCEEMLQALGFTKGTKNSGKLTYSSFPMTIQHFLHQNQNTKHWNVVQSTFALHNVAPIERKEVFSSLFTSCDLLLVAEFNIPIKKRCSYFIEGERVPYIDKEFAQIVYEKYEAAICVWEDNGGFDSGSVSEKQQRSKAVIKGFLIPIMLGYFAVTQKNKTFEVPLTDWVNEIENVGFKTNTTMVHPYWWADCYLLTASDGTVKQLATKFSL